MNRDIYLDNAATTRVLKESAELAYSLMEDNFGNPSSVHLKGFYAEREMIKARKTISKAIGCDEKELIFTGGGTEANNLAILGGVRANKRIGSHVITTEVEHSSVKNVFKHLSEEGYEVTYIPCDDKGLIDADKLIDAIRPDTALVSVMYVNNEVGTIMPVGKLSLAIKEKNPNCLFHVDAIQAVGKLKINLKKTKIDFLSASGHKFHSPKGCGFLYKRKSAKLTSIVFGGGQEDGFRSGTENVPGICAMANSLYEAQKEIDDSAKRLYEYKRAFIDELGSTLDIKLNGYDNENSSPYICNISFNGVRAEVLIHALEEEGIFVSSTSACSSHSKAVSATLSAMGATKEEMDCAIRFSFCRFTDRQSLMEAASVIKEIVPKLSKFKRK